jgi:hypothetical protein
LDELSPDILKLDGHPSFTKDGRYMLTDTYEDAESNRHLLLYNLKTKRKFELGRFYSPFNSCDYRSDLHPRFDFQQNSIIIDTAHSGYHRIMVLDIDWSLIYKEIE